MVKVKTFILNTPNWHQYERLENSINKFLEDNNITEVVDIKYSTTATGDFFYMSALLIYNE